MADAIYVKPQEASEPCKKCGHDVPPQWVVLASDGEKEIAGPFATRGEAKEEAIEQAHGDAVVLLRADGSAVGEMRPETPQRRDRIPDEEQVIDAEAVKE